MPAENKPSDLSFDLNTPDGGRGYIADLFKTVLKRHDYRQYINDRLAGDFACTLAQHLETLKTREAALQLRLNAADQRIDVLEGAMREIVHNYNHGHLQHTHKAIIAAEQLIEPAEKERDQGIPGTSFQRLNMLANQGE